MDSVIIGYHHEARNDQTLDTRFADKNIAAIKFDSVFEIRAHKVAYINTKSNLSALFLDKGLTKHLTLHYSDGGASCIPYGESNQGFILAKIKYPPLKLSWNSSMFNNMLNPCANRTFLLHNEYFTQVLPPAKIPFTVYLEENSSIADSLPDSVKEYINGLPGSINKKIGIRYLDDTLDTLQANYQFIFRSRDIATISEHIESNVSIKVFPNPCLDRLMVLLPVEDYPKMVVNIYGVDGALLLADHTFVGNVVTINTSSLSPGQYVVELLASEKLRFIGKFFKL